MRLFRTLFAYTVAAVLGIGSMLAVYAGNSESSSTEHVVQITGFKFVPESLTVKTGDTITWVNKDIVPHTASALDNTFDTGILELNESGSIIVSSDQTITYFCKFHPSMKANLVFE